MAARRRGVRWYMDRDESTVMDCGIEIYQTVDADADSDGHGSNRGRTQSQSRSEPGTGFRAVTIGNGRVAGKERSVSAQLQARAVESPALSDVAVGRARLSGKHPSTWRSLRHGDGRAHGQSKQPVPEDGGV